jgi:hypothetical protein
MEAPAGLVVGEDYCLLPGWRLATASSRGEEHIVLAWQKVEGLDAEWSLIL